MENSYLIYLVAAMICAALISFTMTPIASVIAYKVGAIDIPKDNRRMHKKPMPLLGGLAIFAGFTIASMVFGNYSRSLLVLWFGGLVIVVLGMLDDIYRLSPLIKLIVQIGAAFIPVSQGLKIEFINLFGEYVTLGSFAIPVTVIWIVGLTNAINIIDGLDGLACGVSAICSLSLLLVMLTTGANPAVTLVTGILAGACLGFLPFNSNPAKIFMGDSGALFLGYTMAVISVDGLFKFHAVLSFLIPVSIFGLPLFDTVFAFFRRIFTGKNPFRADRGHIHHRLIDMGFNQKQSVSILYSICGILGISAVMFTSESILKAALIVISGLAIFVTNYRILKNPVTRVQSGIEIPNAKIGNGTADTAAAAAGHENEAAQK